MTLKAPSNIKLKAPTSNIKGGSEPVKGLIEATLGLAVFTGLVSLLN